jgi:hypothetical protein
VKEFEMDDLKAEAELHFDGVVMDFELFYEEIEGFGLVYAFEDLTTLETFQINKKPDKIV